MNLFERVFNRLNSRGLLKFVPDKTCIKILFHGYLGYYPNLDNPSTYNEKLQWIKLYDRNPIYNTFVDKVEVKRYVSNIIGHEHVIPTLGVWDNADDIDFDTLPSQFVLKTTHDSRSTIICKNKDEFNRMEAIQFLNKKLKRNMFWTAREWPYKDVKPRILAEKYMIDNLTQELRDYKFYCFNGVVKAVMIATGRSTGYTCADYFDRNFKHLDFTWGYPMARKMPDKPHNYEQMIRFAEVLSKGYPELRVDFYEVNKHVYLGELTLFDGGGFSPFEPRETDKVFGEFIDLNLLRLK